MKFGILNVIGEEEKHLGVTIIRLHVYFAKYFVGA